MDIGPPIAKGCSAVVYAAAFKDDHENVQSLPQVDVPTVPSTSSFDPSYERSLLSPIQNMGRFTHNFGGSVDNLYNFNNSPRESLASLHSYASRTVASPRTEPKSVRFNDNLEMRSRLSSVSSESYELAAPDVSASEDASIYRYPLALKMMFNYDIQSNAMSILKAMHKETIPARRRQNVEVENWEKM